MEKISESVQQYFDIYPASVKCKVSEIERKVRDYKKYQDKYEFCPPDIIVILLIDNQEIDVYEFQNADDYFTIESEDVNILNGILDEIEKNTNEEEEIYEEEYYEYEEEYYYEEEDTSEI